METFHSCQIKAFLKHGCAFKVHDGTFLSAHKVTYIYIHCYSPKPPVSMWYEKPVECTSFLIKHLRNVFFFFTSNLTINVCLLTVFFLTAFVGALRFFGELSSETISQWNRITPNKTGPSSDFVFDLCKAEGQPGITCCGLQQNHNLLLHLPITRVSQLTQQVNTNNIYRSAQQHMALEPTHLQTHIKLAATLGSVVNH